MNINYLVEISLNNLKDPDSLFDSGKVNDNAKYMPKFLKKIKKPNLMPAKIMNIFKINPKTIPGTNISVDANKEEMEADKLLRSQGLMK